MAEIILTEDNEALAEAVAGYLEADGHRVVRFSRLQGVETAIRMRKPDLLILDVMLPDGDGFRFARSIREYGIAVLFLTARSTESDRITGLELGAEDYVVKPFSMRELVLRVRKILERSTPKQSSPETETWTVQNSGTLHRIRFDNGGHRCFIDDREISLTAAEWRILQYLAANEGMVISREQILGTCLDSYAEGSLRSVNTHMKNIRAKIGSTIWVETVRGFGYRFTGRKQPL